VILETLVDFYKNQTNESLCNSVFKTMFHAGMYDGRKELLYRLVSMAVGVECSHLLNSAAVWMQVSSTTHVHGICFTMCHFYCTDEQVKCMDMLRQIYPGVVVRGEMSCVVFT